MIIDNERKAYAEKSYEYVIGAIKATTRPPLSKEQWNRLREASQQSAEKLLIEFGYPPAADGGTVRDAIEAGLSQDIDFILSLSPDKELTSLLFFEIDALNLKLLLKSKLLGKNSGELILANGGFPRDILRICVNTGDYSLLGKKLDKMLEGIAEESDPFKLSCRVDSAMFAYALETASKRNCRPVSLLLTEYGVGRNRLTALRLRRLEMYPKKYDFAFLPVDFSLYEKSDNGKTDADIEADIGRRLENILSELSFDSGMGVVAQYYFTKKNEAAELRLLFAEKSLLVPGGAKV